MIVLQKLMSFLGKVDGARKGLIVPEELYRSIVTALGSGAATSLLIALLQAVVDHSGEVFPDPSVAGPATAFLALVIDLLRRQNQGTPKPADAPAA